MTNETNKELLAQGLPQLATKPPKKALSLADICKHEGAKAPSAKTGVVPASNKHMEKICPELVAGLVDPATGTVRPGCLEFHDKTGKYGRKGARYFCRFVPINKSAAKFVLDKFGKANRTRTKSKQTDYTSHMNVGIGGDSGPKGWNFVFQTCILTVDTVGNITGIDLEQHNAGHQFSALLDATDPAAETLVLMCFGVPKELRDNIDKNVARSPKDIASTRTELRVRFFKGAILGGVVTLTEAMAVSCIGEVSQVIRIIECIRKGREAKTSGAVEVGTDQLDQYSDAVAQAIEMIYALDYSSCPYDAINKKTLAITAKTGGGLKHRFAMNHTASILAIASSYLLPDGSLGFDQDVGITVLQAYKVLGNKEQTDRTEPMVCLRHTIDRWDRENKHSGTNGMNVRWTALKLSLLMQLSGDKIANPFWLDGIDYKKANDDENYRLNGLGTAVLEDGTEIVCGIDDYVYVDPAKAAAEAASEEPTDDGSLHELAEDDEEELQDTPEDEDEEEIDE